MTTPTVLAGRGAPPRAFGRDGWFWIDMRAWRRHGPKAGGVWPPGVSIIPATALPDPSDDLPLATTSGATLTTAAGATLAGDIR